MRLVGAGAAIAGYLLVAIVFHPTFGETTSTAAMMYVVTAWLLALVVCGALLGAVGGVVCGFFLGLGQLPVELMHGDGHPIVVSLLATSAAVGMATGGFSGAFANMQRQSRRRTAELAQRHEELRQKTEQLATSDKLFRQFADRVDVGIWIQPIAPPGPGFANRAADRLYGATGPVEDWRRNIHPDDRERVLASVEALNATGEQTIEYRLVREDGGMRWVLAHSFLVLDAEGKTTVAAGLLQDITAQKERESNRDAIERRERLSALGTLMAGVAHEINNPLTYLMGNMELAQEQLEKARARAEGAAPDLDSAARLLDTSVDGGERIAKIVKALKAVTRPPSDGSRSRVALNAVATDIHALMRTNVPVSVDFQLVTSPVDPVVLGDSGEIAQVLLNLATNAVQAIGSRPGRVVIETRRMRDDAEIVVRDDGPGITPDVRERLFTPFFTTKPEGTGLGLNLVHTIVRDHGGDVEVESHPGRGATFRVRLPLAPQQVIS